MFDPAEFLDITQRDYQGQSQEEIARVSIPGGSLIPLSRIGLAYKQSGAMTWFLMNERGAEGRALLMEYMSDFYRGASDPDAWRALGFESAADFDAEFRAFLARHFDLFS